MKKLCIAVGICVLSIGLFVGPATAFSTTTILADSQDSCELAQCQHREARRLGNQWRVHLVRGYRGRLGFLQQLFESGDQHRGAERRTASLSR